MDYNRVGSAAAGTSNYPIDKQANEPDSASRIRDGIGKSEELLSELHETLNRFEKRFDTVLLPSPPSTSTGLGGNTPTPVNSHVMGRIDILNEGYRHAIERIRDVMRRTEL